MFLLLALLAVPPMVAVLSETRADGEPLFAAIRIAFLKSPAGWAAFPSPGAPSARDLESCDQREKPTPHYAFPDSAVVIGKSYASGAGARIVTVSIRETKKAHHCGEMADAAWDSQTFAVPASGAVRHLGGSMDLLDAGDYAGDGRSELVFGFYRYNGDGYVLVAGDFSSVSTYGWSYH